VHAAFSFGGALGIHFAEAHLPNQMSPTELLNRPGACDLESVIATDELEARKRRTPDIASETEAHLWLMRGLSVAPAEFFSKVVNAAKKLSNAGSTGISLLNAAQDSFIWPAVAGPLGPYVGGGTPRDFGPCGTVLDRDAAVLFVHPERHFAYLTAIAPPLEEVLLVPFHMWGKPVGTLWAVIHEKGRKFDGEDRRLLEGLCSFAESAYRAFSETGVLQPLLDAKPTAAPLPQTVF